MLHHPATDLFPMMSDAELAEEKRLAHDRAAASAVKGGGATRGQTSPLVVILAWTAVGIPLAWGVYRTFLSVGKFFH